MTVVAYGKGVIAAEQYHCRITAEKFSLFVCEHSSSMFIKSANPRGKLFLQDGDPLQNSVKSTSTWDEAGAQKFTIPARSSGLNPIEHVFHIVKRRLRQDPLG